MKIKLSTKDAIAAIETVCSMSGSSTISLYATKAGLRIAAQSKSMMVSRTIKCEVLKSGSCSVEGFMLSKVMRGRAQISMENSDSTMQLTGPNRWNVELVSIPLEEVPPLAKKEGDEVDAGLLKLLTTSLSEAGITNVHGEKALAFRIRMTKKTLTVMTADENHVAYVHHDGLKNKTSLSFNVGAQAFSQIGKLAGGEPFKVHFSESELLAWSPVFELRMPTLNDDGGPDDETMLSLINSLLEGKPTCSIQVAREEWNTALTTMEGIFEANASVSLVTDKAGLSVQFSTSYGKVTTVVKGEKAKGTFGHSMDLPLANDTFGHSDSKFLNLYVAGDRQLYSKEQGDGKTLLYFMSLVAQSKATKTTKTKAAK